MKVSTRFTFAFLAGALTFTVAQAASTVTESQPQQAQAETQDKSHSWTPKKVGKVDLTKLKSKQKAKAAEATEHSADDGHGHGDAGHSHGDGHDHGAQQAVPASDSSSTARLTVPEGMDTFHFEDVIQGATPSHTFLLSTAGEEDTIIHQIKPSCGCTVAETAVVAPDGTRTEYQTGSPIPPGSRVEVKTSLKTENKRGPVSTNVALYTNDGEFAVRRLTLKARVKPLVDIEPTSLNLGQLMHGDKADGVIHIKSSEGTPIMVTLEPLMTRGEPFEVTLVPTEPNAEGKSTDWEARIVLGPGLSEGIKNFPMQFSTDLPIAGAPAGENGEPRTHQVRAYAMAQVQALVYNKPSHVSFGLMRPGEEVARTFTVLTRDEEFEFPENAEVTVEGLRGAFEFPDNLTITAKVAENKNSLEVEMVMADMPEDFQGSFSGMVKVKVGHPTKDEVTCRFSGSCRPGVR